MHPDGVLEDRDLAGTALGAATARVEDPDGGPLACAHGARVARASDLEAGRHPRRATAVDHRAADADVGALGEGVRHHEVHRLFAVHLDPPGARLHRGEIAGAHRRSFACTADGCLGTERGAEREGAIADDAGLARQGLFTKALALVETEGDGHRRGPARGDVVEAEEIERSRPAARIDGRVPARPCIHAPIAERRADGRARQPGALDALRQSEREATAVAQHARRVGRVAAGEQGEERASEARSGEHPLA